jgi:hypothetical protein
VRKRQILHHATADEMFLNDPFQRLRPRRAVPHALRIDQRNGPLAADAQTVGARAIDPVKQSEFTQPPLQIVPSLEARLARTALGLSLVGAKKNVPPHAGDVQLARAFQYAFGIGHIC